MKRKIDWLQFGQFLAMVTELWTIIRDEFSKRKVGPEILEWLNGQGREFLKDQLATLVEGYKRFLERQKQKGQSAAKVLVVEVDLDWDPDLPFDDAVLTKHVKQGKKVRIEYRSDEDELYIDGKKLIGWLSPEQLDGQPIQGIKLEPEANKHNSLNATAADWLYAHQEFIPKKWRNRVWYFWGTEWRVSGGGRSVRCLHWVGFRWTRSCNWLGNFWTEVGPSASLES